MALIFPVLVRQVNGHYEAETPALPGWSSAGAGADRVLAHARLALEAEVASLERFEFVFEVSDGFQVHQLEIEEPWSWFQKPPNE